MGSHHLHKKNLHSFILTQLDDGSHLEFHHVGFRHCHLGFRHLLIFSWIHSKTLSLHSDSWLKLIQSDSNLFILTQLYDGSHLEFCHLEFGHLGFSHLSFSSITHSHLPGLVPTICTKKPSLNHSDSTWWWQSSWILPCWIQTPCFLLSDSLKNTLTPLWLWLKLNWLILLTQLAILNLAILDSAILVFPLKLTHTCQDGFPPFAQKNLHSFILTQLDDGSHLEFYHVGFRHCHLGFRHLLIFSQIHSKTLSLHSESN